MANTNRVFEDEHNNVVPDDVLNAVVDDENFRDEFYDTVQNDYDHGGGIAVTDGGASAGVGGVDPTMYDAYAQHGIPTNPATTTTTVAVEAITTTGTTITAPVETTNDDVDDTAAAIADAKQDDDNDGNIDDEDDDLAEADTTTGKKDNEQTTLPKPEAPAGQFLCTTNFIYEQWLKYNPKIHKKNPIEAILSRLRSEQRGWLRINEALAAGRPVPNLRQQLNTYERYLVLKLAIPIRDAEIKVGDLFGYAWGVNKRTIYMNVLRAQENPEILDEPTNMEEDDDDDDGDDGDGKGTKRSRGDSKSKKKTISGNKKRKVRPSKKTLALIEEEARKRKAARVTDFYMFKKAKVLEYEEKLKLQQQQDAEQGASSASNTTAAGDAEGEQTAAASKTEGDGDVPVEGEGETAGEGGAATATKLPPKLSIEKIRFLWKKTPAEERKMYRQLAIQQRKINEQLVKDIHQYIRNEIKNHGGDSAKVRPTWLQLAQRLGSKSFTLKNLIRLLPDTHTTKKLVKRISTLPLLKKSEMKKKTKRTYKKRAPKDDDAAAAAATDETQKATTENGDDDDDEEAYEGNTNEDNEGDADGGVTNVDVSTDMMIDPIAATTTTDMTEQQHQQHQPYDDDDNLMIHTTMAHV